MVRFYRLLIGELQLFRTAIPIHLVVVFQPTVMYLLMAAILVHPTFDVYMARPQTEEGASLLEAMSEVGSPIGQPYIHPILVEPGAGDWNRQLITVEDRNGVPVAVQRYGLIDSNLVKNFRNRLTAAGLRLWSAELGGRAVTVQEVPWLPRDMPYTLYFGMSMLPPAAFLAASVIGAILTAQEFEFQTIIEYRLAPAPEALILAARLTRLVLTAWIAAGLLLVAIGLRTDGWPDALWDVGLILLPVAVIAGGLGVLAGLLLRKTIPAFLIGLISSFVGWLLGSAFGLAAGFGPGYEIISRLMPNTHAVELLFPHYFGTSIGTPLASGLTLVVLGGGMLLLTSLAYRWRVTGQA